MEKRDISLVVGMDTPQGHREGAPDNGCTSKLLKVVDYNEVDKRAVEGSVAVAGVKSSFLEPQL